MKFYNNGFVKSFALVGMFLLPVSASPQSNLTQNMIADPNFESAIADAKGDFETPSVGKWTFFRCDATTQAAAVQSVQSSSVVANSVKVTVSSNPSNTIWGALLYQDFENLLPLKYEFTFRAKSEAKLREGIYMSVVDKLTNTVLKGFSSECFKFDTKWGVYVADVDLSSFSAKDLSDVRIMFNFAETAECQIGHVTMRPVYTVPFVDSKGNALNSAGYLGFDKTPNEFWCGPMASSTSYSTESTQAQYSVVGNITTNGALLRYTIFPQWGAQPMQGRGSLYVDVQEIYGTPDYEVSFVTPNFAPEVLGRKIRISYWAKTDGAATGEMRIQPRFAGSSKQIAHLTPEWNYFSYDYTVPSTTTLPYIRLQFYKVGACHVDWFNVEYADVPTAVSTPMRTSDVLGEVRGGQVHILSAEARKVEVFDASGRKVKSVNCSCGGVYGVASSRGTYILKITGENNQSQSLIVQIK